LVLETARHVRTHAPHSDDCNGFFIHDVRKLAFQGSRALTPDPSFQKRKNILKHQKSHCSFALKIGSPSSLGTGAPFDMISGVIENHNNEILGFLDFVPGIYRARMFSKTI
jgi:hypothetical protein